MVNHIHFNFRGQSYPATVHLSLQDDGCYIFTFLEDKALIAEFGSDIDIATDCIDVIPDHTTNDAITTLKVAILEAVKQLPEFHAQKPQKLIIRSSQLN
jgi:hypothetical protein